MYVYLQGGDAVIVQRSHLFLSEGVSCLVADFKTCVKLQHVQQLQGQKDNSKLRFMYIIFSDWHASIFLYAIPGRRGVLPSLAG